MKKEPIPTLMIGGPVDGERWTTDGRERIFVPEREELPSAIMDFADCPIKPNFKVHEYIARRLRSETGEWFVYQDAAMDIDVIEALIRGYKTQEKD